MDDNVFFSYLSCKYKGYLTFKGEKGELSEYGILKTKLRQDYKNAVISTIICRDKQSFVPQDSPLTIANLKRGDPFIVNAAIKYKSIICRLDALKRLDGKSSLGPFHYVPVVFSKNDIIGKQVGWLLTFESLLLSHVQKNSVWPWNSYLRPRSYIQDLVFRKISESDQPDC